MNANEKKITRGMLLLVGLAVLGMAFLAAPQASYAEDNVTPPPIPPDLQPVDAGNSAFLVGHAVGSQNYVCLPCTPGPSCPTGFAYSLFTPEATLFDDEGDQLITHFFSPNPDENLTIRATWESSRDTSTVWAATVPNGASTDPNFVAKDSVAWLTLKVVGRRDGPTGGDRLTQTTFIQRLNTMGGVAPSTGCSALSDVGTRAFVPYTADYFFFRKD